MEKDEKSALHECRYGLRPPPTCHPLPSTHLRDKPRQAERAVRARGDEVDEVLEPRGHGEEQVPARRGHVPELAHRVEIANGIERIPIPPEPVVLDRRV